MAKKRKVIQLIMWQKNYISFFTVIRGFYSNAIGDIKNVSMIITILPTVLVLNGYQIFFWLETTLEIITNLKLECNAVFQQCKDVQTKNKKPEHLSQL